MSYKSLMHQIWNSTKTQMQTFCFGFRLKVQLKLLFLLLFHKKPVQTVSGWENLTKPVKNMSESYFIPKYFFLYKRVLFYLFFLIEEHETEVKCHKKGDMKKCKMTFCMKKTKPFFGPRSYLRPKSKEKYVLH